MWTFMASVAKDAVYPITYILWTLFTWKHTWDIMSESGYVFQKEFSDFFFCLIYELTT